MGDGSTLVNYDIHGSDQPDRLLRMIYSPKGQINMLGDAPTWDLPQTAWRLPRRVRSESPSSSVRILEDTPFYQRGLVTQTHQGQSVLAFHESLSVPRLTHPLVQAVLPWRMPRKMHA